jgi:hypothetical protein
MIVKFVDMTHPVKIVETVIECDSISRVTDSQIETDTFTMNSKTHGKIEKCFYEFDLVDIYYMSDSGKTIDTIHLNQVKVSLNKK